MNNDLLELQARLDHLTKFVGGVVLVGSDSPSQLSNFTHQYLSHLEGEVNLAFFKAEANASDSSNRRQVLSQLLGRTVIEGGKPLSQSLSAVTTDSNNQMLLIITQAENLSVKFIKELALLNKKLLHKRVTVMLFGHEAWFLSTGQLLMSQEPIMINFNSEQSVEQPDDIAKFIAEKRAAFQQRMDKRRKAESALIHKRWFHLSAAGSVFLVFAAIVGLLYPESVKGLIDDTDISASSPLAEIELAAAVETGPAEPSVAEETIEIASIPPPENEVVSAEVDTHSLSLVSNWTKQIESFEQELKQQELEMVAVLDSAVTDQSKEQTEPAVETPEIITEAAELAVAAEDKPQKASIDNFPKGAYVLQLMGASDPQTIDSFIQKHQLEQKTARYQTKRYGGQWHVVLWDTGFDSLNQAKEALNALPVSLRQTQPFAKSTIQVQREIDLASNS